jgi:hypothetical protein
MMPRQMSPDSYRALDDELLEVTPQPIAFGWILNTDDAAAVQEIGY